MNADTNSPLPEISLVQASQQDDFLAATLEVDEEASSAKKTDTNISTEEIGEEGTHQVAALEKPKTVPKKKRPSRTGIGRRRKVRGLRKTTVAKVPNEVKPKRAAAMMPKKGGDDYAQDVAFEESIQANPTNISCIEHKSKARRLAVAYLFETIYFATPDKSEWPEIEKNIQKRPSIARSTSLTKIFENVIACRKNGTYYVGDHTKSEIKIGRPRLKKEPVVVHAVVTTHAIHSQTSAQSLLHPSTQLQSLPDC